MNSSDAIHAADERLQTLLKAVVVGARIHDPASRSAGEDTSGAFTSAGALVPPYDPETLCLLVEHSHFLRQNVDSYATNIDGNGYRFDAIIDFEAEDARSKVADAMTLERLAMKEARTLPEGMATTPSAEEVSARFNELHQLARIERARLESFFDFACFDHSFVDLRRRTRQDLEVTGNAFWEVLRDGKGDLARLVYVPSYTARSVPDVRDSSLAENSPTPCGHQHPGSVAPLPGKVAYFRWLLRINADKQVLRRIAQPRNHNGCRRHKIEQQPLSHRVPCFQVLC